MNIINEIFTSEINEVPGTDFMEVIDNKLNDYFNRLLLNIINYFLNKNISRSTSTVSATICTISNTGTRSRT